MSDSNFIKPDFQRETTVEIPHEILENLKSEQNLPKAIISGIAAGIICAILWGAITVITNYQIGYLAIALGAGVGFTIRYFGKGITAIFGISGAIIAILSTVLGNFLSIIGYVANYEGLGYFETLTLFDYSQLIPVMTETFSFMDIIFYAIAGYEGYKFAFRVITNKDLGINTTETEGN